MAADVLMGNDPDCGRWILANREPTPEGEVSRRRVNRRARRARRLRPQRPCRPPPRLPSRSSSSRRRAGAAGSPKGRPSSTRRGRSASTSTRSAAAAASAAAARSTQGLGAFPKHGITSEPDHLLGVRRARGDLSRRRRAWPPTAGCRAPRTVRGDVLIDVPPESQVHRQVVRKGLDVRDLHGRPGRPPPLRRGHAAGAGVADGRPRPTVRGARARVAADRPRGRPRGRPRAPAGARGGQVRRHGRGPRRPPGHRRLAGAPRDRVRRGDRHRLDDHRRPPREPRPTARSSRATAS